MTEGPGQRSSRTLYLVAVVGSLVLLAATGLRPTAESAAPVIRRVFGILNLGSENNLASWWGGMLLFLAAAYAWDCSARARSEESGAGAAWAAISGILLFFSADEVSSLHERMGRAGISVGSFAWLSARDLLAIGLASVAFICLLRLWRTPGERRSAGGLFLGFLILATIYPQETLEHRVEWSGEGVRTLRLVIEEGTELLGSLVILRVAMSQAAPQLMDGFRRRETATFGVLRPLSPPGMLVGVLVSAILAILTARLPDQYRGHPADWFAATAFLAAGLLVLRPLLRGQAGMRPALAAAAATCIVASALAVALDPLRLVPVGSLWLNLRVSSPAVLGVLFALTCGSSARPGTLPVVVVALAAGVVATGWSLSLPLIYLFTQLVALAAYHVASRRPAA